MSRDHADRDDPLTVVFHILPRFLQRYTSKGGYFQLAKQQKAVSESNIRQDTLESRKCPYMAWGAISPPEAG